MHFLTKVLYLSFLFYKSSQGFNIKPFTTLEAIVSSKAIASAIVNRLNAEVFNENIIISGIMHHNTHIEADILYFIFITGSVLYRATEQEKVTQKLTQFDTFSTIQKRTNVYLFILAIVFTRNIENAI
jgi:hypothetical protein